MFRHFERYSKTGVSALVIKSTQQVFFFIYGVGVGEVVRVGDPGVPEDEGEAVLVGVCDTRIAVK